MDDHHSVHQVFEYSLFQRKQETGNSKKKPSFEMAMGGPSCVYEDFNPPADLCLDIFRVHLPGFKKDQLRVQLTTSRLLKISGERPIGENKWRRFYKEFRVPDDCDTTEITAKFEGGILYIRLPKAITPPTACDQLQDKAKRTTEPPKPQLPQPQPPSYVPKKDAMPKAKEEDEGARARREKKAVPSKAEEKKQESRLTKAAKQVVAGGSRLFTNLRKPENLMKRVVLPVFVLLILGLYIFYMSKLFTRIEDQQES